MAPLAGSLTPGQLQETEVPFDNPFGLGGAAGTAVSVLTMTAVVLHWLSLPAALASLVLRFQSSVGVERQQLRWVAAGAALTIVGLLAGAVVAAAGYAAVLCIPVAVAIAVLRYRLWDLDRLVSRTVTYALVTGLLVLPYLLLVPGGWPPAPAASGWRLPPWPRWPPSPRCAAGSRAWSTQPTQASLWLRAPAATRSSL